MKRAVLAIAAVALLAGCGDDETSTGPSGDPIAAVAGTWAGTLHQKSTSPFPIEVTIASSSDPAANVVDYGGSIGCSGTWSYIGTDAESVQFEEVIDSGEGGPCKGRGAVTVRPAGGDLDYVFRGGGVESRGVLHSAG
jgi:hypothetical protein